jgi:hypothetical protein
MTCLDKEKTLKNEDFVSTQLQVAIFLLILSDRRQPIKLQTLEIDFEIFRERLKHLKVSHLVLNIFLVQRTCSHFDNCFNIMFYLD